MGAHAWLLLATMVTELLVIRKWGKNIYTQPFPKHIKWSITIGILLLALYPVTKVRFSSTVVFHSLTSFPIHNIHFPATRFISFPSQ